MKNSFYANERRDNLIQLFAKFSCRTRRQFGGCMARVVIYKSRGRGSNRRRADEICFFFFLSPFLWQRVFWRFAGALKPPVPVYPIKR
jgi:hypothetical protein